MHLVNRQELAKALETTPASIGNWKGCPKYSRGKWDLDEVAQWIVDTFKFGKIKSSAERYLNLSSSEKSKAKETKSTFKKKELSEETGILGMMARLRATEINTGMQYAESSLQDDFNRWSKICETLCKAEKQFDEIMLKRRAVVSIDDATAYFFEMVIPVKQQLKSLGADLSHELAAIEDPQEIKDLIDSKVMEIMRGLPK